MKRMDGLSLGAGAFCIEEMLRQGHPWTALVVLGVLALDVHNVCRRLSLPARRTKS